MKELNHPYLHERMVLTSKHEKLALIAPPFQQGFDAAVFEIPLDTDSLGTFTGECERSLSQLETAIKKAQMGIEVSGIPIGLASEGAIGIDSEIPFMNSDLELLVLVDATRKLVIAEYYRSFEIVASTTRVQPGDDLTEFLQRANFPSHALIVKSHNGAEVQCVKGLTDLDELQLAIEQLSERSSDGLVTIESDLRAHFSPTRRENIKIVAERLAARVLAQCPQCATPGWGRVGYQRGLSCSECNVENTDAIHREILGCTLCPHQEPGAIIAQALDPARCFECNP